MKALKILLFLSIALILTSCADVIPVQECVTEDPYGFWNGLWHGFISPFAFIGSLFNDSIAIYAVNNNGAWYNFGFVIGCSIIFGGGSSSTPKKK